MSVIEPQIVEYGPYRVVGMQYLGKNENGEITEMWGGKDGFISRMNEIQPLTGECITYGLCRCRPGVTDGSFDYVAAAPVAEDAPIPEGMVEASIGAHTYAVVTVQGLDQIGQAWNDSHQWLASNSEWESCCSEGNCECAKYPFFELYPSDFCTKGELFIYLPVRKKQVK